MQYKHCTSTGFLPCNSMNITGRCLHRCIMCQLIRAQPSCFTNGCSIYVCDWDPCLVNTWRNVYHDICLSVSPRQPTCINTSVQIFLLACSIVSHNTFTYEKKIMLNVVTTSALLCHHVYPTVSTRLSNSLTTSVQLCRYI